MLKKYLDNLKSSISKDEFEGLMQIVTDDIKFNRIGFKKTTKSEDIIEIIKNSMPLIPNLAA